MEEEYDVVIEATVRKTVRVTAKSEELATELAHDQFHCLADIDGQEKYDEQMISCNKV
jgi:hypothetical protein